MAKRKSGRTKKGLKGLVRITKGEGTNKRRVWLYMGKEYLTLRDVRTGNSL